jgi:hypothetical protein
VPAIILRRCGATDLSGALLIADMGELVADQRAVNVRTGRFTRPDLPAASMSTLIRDMPVIRICLLWR